MNTLPRKSSTRSGIQRWKLDGVYHREDGPAVIHPNGYEEWWLHGLLNKVGGPAIDSPNRKEWWINGQLIKVEWAEDIDQKWIPLFEEGVL
jgi:hypothetical protein